MTKSALITGVTGQDGSYLAELLLGKGYEVHGIVRRSSSFNTERLDDIYQDPHVESRRLFLHYGDLSDASSLVNLLREVQPHEIYNLGAQSHVKVSFETPEYTGDVTGLGALRLLEAVRAARRETRVYQASTSELFGASPPPQSEATAFHPRSPYGVAKLYAYWATVNYREAYDMFAVNGILFNHESPRRGETFVTRKLTRAAARDQGGDPGPAVHGKHGLDPRLGLRARVRRGHVADAAGRPARATSSSRPVSARASSSSPRWRSRRPGSTTASTSRSTRRTTGPPRCTISSATRRRPRRSSGGRRPPTGTSSRG